jgi:hypothetical protein
MAPRVEVRRYGAISPRQHRLCWVTPRVTIAQEALLLQ